MMNRFNLLLKQLTFFLSVYIIVDAFISAGRTITHVVGTFSLPLFSCRFFRCVTVCDSVSEGERERVSDLL